MIAIVECPSRSLTTFIGTSAASAKVAQVCRRSWNRITQTTVAERAAVNVSYLSELESGKHNPTVGLAVRLARALDVKPSQLLARLDDID